MLEIVQIPVLQDNYIFLLHTAESGETAAVDPAVAEPVLDTLAQKGWRLTHILNTHHHGDHVGGNLALKRATGCRIVGAAKDRARIPGIDIEVGERDVVHLGKHRGQVLDVPGHTLGHIAYWFAEEDALFCGDTLFALGCGRLFEGSAEEMWGSLLKISALPPSTRIYCAHEYTQANARFALTVEPGNFQLVARSDQIDSLRKQGLPTVPATLAEELTTNPFLRPQSTEIRLKVDRGNAEDLSDVKIFARIRQMKDEFRG